MISHSAGVSWSTQREEQNIETAYQL